MANDIPARQNEDAQIRLLRARSATYSSATRLMWLQIALTVIVPTVGSILGVFSPESRAYVALASLLVAVIDPIILDRWYKRLLKRAAKIAEQFDCTVLTLPWDSFAAGTPVDPEDIHSAAKTYARWHKDDKLLDWYPSKVGSAPLHLARILCQRVNLRYDGRLRRSYGVILVGFSTTIVAGLFLSGFFQNLSLRDWVLGMAPAVPVLGWSAREYFRQSDTADALDHLKTRAETLWEDARTGSCGPEECLIRSREFQGAIYNRRADSPLVLPFVYSMMRLRLEDEMLEGTEILLKAIDN